MQQCYEANVSRITRPLVISRCCFAEKGQINVPRIITHVTATVLLIKLSIIDVQVIFAVVVLLDSPLF